MDFSINDVENILNNLKDNPEQTLYTEHFLEKAGHRNIDDVEVCNRLEYCDFISIRKFEGLDHYFELVYSWDDTDDLVVVIHIMQTRQVVIITAYFREVEG